MSPRRSLLLRRISGRSFALSKSFKELRTPEAEGKPMIGDGKGDGEDIETEFDGGCWSTMLPELLGEIIQRLEASEDRWPVRRNVVACACVCKRWREVTQEIVRPPLHSGKITFPSNLKQPGTRDSPLQCLIRRNKKDSTFYLYLGLTSSLTDKGKLLLAARRCRHGAHTEYIISLDADDISQGSNAYVGKLSSDFLGTNFTIYDGQPPFSGAKPLSSKSGRRFASKQISPQVPAGNFEVGQVSYKFNLLKSRGPRRMACSIMCPCSEETISNKCQDKSKMKSESSPPGCAVLRNKAPRWHEHLQCWCLNFHGRVTVASVKNFQLVATMDPSQPGGKGDEETVLLQFGKVGEDTFTMDYRQPLSAFQAFAICLCDRFGRNDFLCASAAPSPNMSIDIGKGFGKSLVLTVVSELGDKTFFTAAILAMQNPRRLVLSGCLTALIVMTIFSAVVGWASPNLISRKWSHHVTTLLFLGFGLWSLWDAVKGDVKAADELKEVEAKLADDLKKHRRPFLTQFFSPIFLKAFSLTFFGEWGDKSQLATIGLAADENAFGVILGGIFGQAMCTTLAVVGGKSLAKNVSERMVALSAGVIFTTFGIFSFLSTAES